MDTLTEEKIVEKPEPDIGGKCLTGLGTGITNRILCYDLIILETAMVQIRAVFRFLHLKNLL